DTASAQGSAFRIIDTSSYRIVVDIDQLDLKHIQVGQDVIVRVDAFSDLRLQGKVTDIGWLPTSSSGVVSYPVEVTVSSVTAAPTPIVQLRGLQGSETPEGSQDATQGAPRAVQMLEAQGVSPMAAQQQPQQDLSQLRPGL